MVVSPLVSSHDGLKERFRPLWVYKTPILSAVHPIWHQYAIMQAPTSNGVLLFILVVVSALDQDSGHEISSLAMDCVN